MAQAPQPSPAAEAAPAPAPDAAAPAPAPAVPPAPPAGDGTGTATGAPAPGPEAPPPSMGLAGWLVVAILVAFFVAVGVKLARRRRAEREGPALPPKAERIPPIAPRDADLARRKEAADEKADAAARELAENRAKAFEAEAEQRRAEEARKAEAEARRKAEYDARKRAEAEERARRAALEATLPAEERARLEADRAAAEAAAREARALEAEERRLLREAEEERKKAEYRARKEAERAEKERKQREAEEAELARLRALEEERKRAEEEERRKAEERRQRIAAEGGKTLFEGLTRTREGGFVARLAGLFGGGKAEVSEATIGELEEILFTADIGVKTSMNLVEHARERLKNRELSDPGKLRAAIRSDVRDILARAREADPRPSADGLGLPLGETRPWVIMVVGVNGAGKTTTIGKLAAKLKARGKSVILAAGDTFRAAATEQLDVWAERAEVPIVRGPENSDPGAVIFDAVKRATAEGIDVVIADTAGRLHTKAPLMEELRRVKRVIGKAREGAPDEVLLVLDATNGQNAIQQARQFHEALGVTGIVLTKLDGTAKGGVVIGISDELKIPVRLIGIGESLADLRPFDPEEFVSALFG